MFVTSEQLAAMLSEEKKQNIPASSIFNKIPGNKGIVFWVNKQKYFFTWEQLEEYQERSSQGDKVRNLDLPGGLTDYNEIAIPVIELFESLYTVKRERHFGCRDIACWKITDKQQNQSAHLFLSSGFEWAIAGNSANDRVPDCFLFDVYDFCDANGVYIEELFESIA